MLPSKLEWQKTQYSGLSASVDLIARVSFNMRLSKRQKVCCVILAVGLAALVVDRTILRPQGGPAEVSAYSPPGPDEAGIGATEHPDLQSPTVKLAEQLKTLCPDDSLDLSQVRDAFSLPASWLAEIHPENGLWSQQDAVAKFTRDHQLKAVAVDGQASYAVVDERLLVIGQELDGFKLMAVDEGSATFEADGKQVVLRLANDR
jgi:hypothetical protein